MNASKHVAVKAASGIAAVLAVCEAAHLAAKARGALAGYAVIAMVFVACWCVFQFGQLRHPAPAYRRSRGRDPEVAGSPLALAESRGAR